MLWFVAEQRTSHYPNQRWPSLPTHICVTLPPWVKCMHWRICKKKISNCLLIMTCVMIYNHRFRILNLMMLFINFSFDIKPKFNKQPQTTQLNQKLRYRTRKIGAGDICLCSLICWIVKLYSINPPFSHHTVYSMNYRHALRCFNLFLFYYEILINASSVCFKTSQGGCCSIAVTISSRSISPVPLK